MNKWLDSTVKNYKRHFGDCEKPVVWEVGSRDGDDGVELAKRIYTGKDDWFWNNADIVCFEPNPEQAIQIAKKYPEVEVLKIAAANTNGTAKFMVYHGDAGAVGSSSLNLNWKEKDLEGHVIKVKTRRLDELIEDQIIDIMKIDVEGVSMEVVQGIGDKLKQIRIMHIETEVWTGSDKRVEKYMKERNWTLVDVQEQYGGMPDQVWANLAILDD